MKAIVVTDQAAGTAGVKLVERPEPQAAINDVVVQIHASGFTGDELTWPSTWTDRVGRDRTPSIPGHELAGVVTALGYGTTGLSIGQRVFGLTDWYRDGTLAEYVAVEARNLAPLPGDVDFTVGAALVMPGLTAWQGLFEHGRLHAGQSVLVHGAAGVVGSMASQLAREAGAYVIGTGWDACIASLGRPAAQDGIQGSDRTLLPQARGCRKSARILPGANRGLQSGTLNAVFVRSTISKGAIHERSTNRAEQVRDAPPRGDQHRPFSHRHRHPAIGRYYEKVFGARILSLGDGNAPAYLQLANIWMILNVGGGSTPDKPTQIFKRAINYGKVERPNS